MKKKCILLLVLFALSFLPVFSQDGTLDLSLNATGFVIGPGFNGGNVACTVQNDGKILIAGNNDQNQLMLRRYDTDGMLDNTFNGTGIVTTASNPAGMYINTHSIIIQDDGKILVVGTYFDASYAYRIFVIRYTSVGTVDNSYGSGGVVKLPGVGTYADYTSGGIIQSDGKLVIGAYSLESTGGSYKYTVIRLTDTGAPDTGFNGTGISTIDLGSSNFFSYNMMANSGVAEQTDGKIVFVGSYGTSETTRDWIVLRLTSGGILDNSFNSVGYVVKDFNGYEDFASGVAIDDNGKIVVAGKVNTSYSSSMAVIRYNEDGSQDITFGSNGVSILNVGSSYCNATAVTLTKDDRIIVGGMAQYNYSYYSVATARLLNNGSMDNSFGTNGYVSADLYLGTEGTSGYGQAIQPDGKIIVTTGIVSNSTFSFARYKQKQILYVNYAAMGNDEGTSWSNAFTSLNSAITNSVSNNEIWVAKGTYKPTASTDRTISFQMKNGVVIYGGFTGTETIYSQRSSFGKGQANETILSGDIGVTGDNSDNSYHVFSNPSGLNLDSTAVLDGFTITGGYANGNSYHNCGGGMYNNGSSPLLVNIVFTGNSAQFGGGLYCDASSPSLINVEFSSNTASMNGGGLNSTNLSYPVLTNSTIAGNYAVDGGGIYHESVSPTPLILNNSIISENASSNNGDEIEIAGSASVMLNYSCYSNDVNDIALEGAGFFTATNNNLTTDPKFVDVSNNDFRLYLNSQCINSGNNVYNTVTNDIRAQSRIQSSTIDMGAYEWTSGIDPDCTNPVSGGTISGNQTICYNTNPAELTNITLPSGFSGTLEYKWQQSTTSSTTGFNDITGTNSESITPGTLTQTTWYKRLARVSCQDDWTGATESNVVEIIIDLLPTATAGGNQTICPEASATVSGATATNGTITWVHDGLGSFTSDISSLTPVYTSDPGDAGNNVTLTMIVTSNNTCTPQTATATYVVTVEYAPVADLTLDGTTTLCSGESTNISVNGSELGVLYQLRNNDGNVEIGTAVSGTGGAINLPTSVLTSTTTFNVFATKGSCSVELTDFETIYVNQNTSSVYTASACESYDFNGVTLTNSGIYYDTIQNAVGCDSVITLHLTINHSQSTFNPQSICEGDLYLLNGHTYYETGIYYDTLQTALGCDSIIETLLNLEYLADVGDAVNGTLLNISIPDITYCNTFATEVSVYPAQSAVNYQLYVNGSPYGFEYTGNNNTVVLNTPMIEGTMQLQVYAQYPQTLCGRLLDTIITIEPIAPQYYYENASVCEGDSILIGTTWVSTSGTYYDYGQCDSILVVTVSVKSIIITGIVTNATTGNNGSINLTVTGGTAPYSYNWSNGMHTEDIGGLAAGVYTVTVTGSGGCTKSKTFIVQTSGCNLTASISTTNVSCNGGTTGSATVNATGGLIPYSYTWSTGSTAQTIQYLTVGTYSVTVTGAGGCITSAITTITHPSAITTSTSVTNAGCNQNNGSANVSVTGGVSPYTYQWSNGISGTTIDNVAAGVYTVTITDSNTCQKTTSVVVGNTGAPVLSAVLNNGTCHGADDGNITVSVSGGTSPYNYSWSEGSTTSSINNLEAGGYILAVSDATGCISMSGYVITEPEIISIQYTVHDVLLGNDGSINLIITGGTAPYSYQWSNSSTEQNITNLSAGSYTVTIHDQHNCELIQTIDVNGAPCAISIATSISDVLCNGQSNGYADITVVNAQQPCNYIWSNGKTTEDLINVSGGTYNLTVTDARGCAANATVVISQPTVLSMTTSTTSANCGMEDGTASAMVSGGISPYHYQWSNGGNEETITDVEAGYYMITVTDNNGCQAFKVVMISNSSSLQLNVQNVTNVTCNGGSNGSIDITVTGGGTPYTYEWSNGATTQDISGLAYGPYEVVVTDNYGCMTATSIQVGQPEAITVTVSTVPANCGNNDGQATATVTGGTSPYSYLWSTSETTATISGLAAGAYSVVVNDANGCMKLKSFTVSNDNGPVISDAVITEASCNGSDGGIDIIISGGTMPFAYNWSNGVTEEDLVDVSSGNYNVEVTDDNGCMTVGDFEVTPQLPQMNPICVVSVDSTTNRNEIIWEKVQTTGIDHYNIYKESTMGGVYQLLVSVPFADMSRYVDLNANPNVRSWRYKLSAVDLCGNESPLSDNHKTIHLTINLGLAQSYNLIWDNYEGFPYYSYFVYRHTAAYGWELIQTMPNNLTTFTDNPPSIEQIFYRVVVDKGDSCWAEGADKTQTGPYSQSVSNLDDNIIYLNIGSLKNQSTVLEVNPNPATDFIKVYIGNTNEYEMRIFDAIGQLVWNEKVKSQFELRTDKFKPGLYFISFSSKDELITKKVIIK